MNVAHHFRDVAEWTVLGGEPEYPGHRPSATITHIRVRDFGPAIVEIAGDRVERRVWWTEPRDAVKPGDFLGGRRVTEIGGEGRDLSGGVLYRTVYTEQ